MSKHRNLNLKKFIDSMPEPLLAEYFKRKKFIIKTYSYDSINKALDNADENTRDCIIEDFTQINDM
jgi:hypothetical protein